MTDLVQQLLNLASSDPIHFYSDLSDLLNNISPNLQSQFMIDRDAEALKKMKDKIVELFPQIYEGKKTGLCDGLSMALTIIPLLSDFLKSMAVEMDYISKGGGSSH